MVWFGFDLLGVCFVAFWVCFGLICLTLDFLGFGLVGFCSEFFGNLSFDFSWGWCNTDFVFSDYFVCGLDVRWVAAPVGFRGGCVDCNLSLLNLGFSEMGCST